MTELALAAAFFLGTHLGISGTPLRSLLVTRIGETVYLLLYAAVSLYAISWLADAYKAAPYIETWGQIYALRPLALVVMFFAFLFVVIGLTTPSPTLVGAESLARRRDAVRGVLRITRHPFLSGVALWAAIHLVINGDLAATILFGALLILAVLGAVSIDHKRADKLGADWLEFAARSSAMPFLAIIQKRNQFRLAELGWWRIALAIIAFAAMLHFHAPLFGISPLPAW